METDFPFNNGCFLLEKNRHSPRIFNKLATKLDISTVNTKLDFMKSLNLHYTSKSRESCAKFDQWEIVLSRNSLPLKPCSVVISLVKCDFCGQTLNNQADVKHHKNLHSRLTILTCNNYASGDANIQDLGKRDITRENSPEKHNNNNNNNNNNNDDNFNNKLNRRHGLRRRSKDIFTKVTLKIGEEIISEVYCKKKYLTKICNTADTSVGVDHDDNCENCNDVPRSNFHNSLENPVAEPNRKFDKTLSGTDQSNSNEARLRKMATALVELELQQKAYCVNEASDFFSKDEFREVRYSEDDAVVPIDNSNFIDSNDVDDDIQEVLRKSRTQDLYLCDATIKECEVITISDECSDVEDDCVILEESIRKQNLRGLENSYVFCVEETNTFT